jgi:hypothetical protein
MFGKARRMINMKKKILSTISFMLLCTPAFTQGVAFETLDSISTYISALQKQTESKIYKESSGNEYELSFPETSFNVWFYNKQASHAVYKKQGEKEVLSLTEGIDLSKVTGITVGEDNNGVVTIKVDFPKDHLRTQLIENGKVTATTKESSLVFYCRYGAVDTDKQFLFDKMFFALYGLAARLKIEKGWMKQEELISEVQDWLALSSEAFYKKHPQSLLSAQAHEIVKREEQEAAALLKKSQDYVQELAGRYRFRPGISLSEFAALDPKNRDIVNKKVKRTVTDRLGNTFYYRENAHFFNVETGPYNITSNDLDIIVYLEYIIEKGSASRLAARLNELAQDIKRNVDKKYIRETFKADDPRQLSEITMNVPGSGLSVKANITNTLSIFFYYIH